jgi:putative ABC transport system permease protein
MRYVGVTPEFFQAMGIAVVRGRTVTPRDRSGSPLVAVLNETAARLYWPDADPVGQRITIGQPVNPEIADPAPREIVGIVNDVREYGMDMDAPPIVYVPLAQVPPPLAAQFRRLLPVFLAMRSSRAPQGLAAAAQAVVPRVDPVLPVSGSATGEQLLAQSLHTRQFNAVLMGALAVLAVVLALSGIYGVLSCLVAQRTSEIGVRLALGATKADVLRLVLAQGLAPAVVGALVGVGGALLSSRLVASLLVNTSPNDPIAIAAGALPVLVLAALAAYVPARRASRVDPLTSIRAAL